MIIASTNQAKLIFAEILAFWNMHPFTQTINLFPPSATYMRL